MNTHKTREQVEALKLDWANDPCWDIEDTEGFEAYYDELKEYHKKCEDEWEKAYEKREALELDNLKRELEELGPLGMLSMIKTLQARLEKAEEEISCLQNPNG
ncbi:hypothetical protein MM188_003231 [Vibrio cholerae]|nr:hypothetical protein [Vibrio cholerae]